MQSLLMLLDRVLALMAWMVVIQVVLSWLIAFDVVNFRNRFVFGAHQVLTRLSEPLLRPIRRLLPDTGSIDISPIVLILGIWFVRSLLVELARG